jgi:hypothetical protein
MYTRARNKLVKVAVLLALAGCAGGLAAAPAAAATDGAYPDVYWVNSCATTASINAALVFTARSFGAMTTVQNCASMSAGLQIDAIGGVGNGASGNWSAITPTPAIRIIGVNAWGLADCNLHHDGFSASYYYGDNGVNYGVPSITIDCHGLSGNSNAGYLNQKITSSRYFGFQASCTFAGGCVPTGANGLVYALTGVTLEAQETSGPSLLAVPSNNLYYQSGWVRGLFPVTIAASDPSGVCSLQAIVNGRTINAYVDQTPDTTRWSQCGGNSIGGTVDTTAYPNGQGTINLSYSAVNAAGAVSSASRSINVDNETPTVSLSGPTDALLTAGTQYVVARASAGPSGVAAISCSVDGGTRQTFPGSAARVSVAGIGAHIVSCFAQNHALNANGQPGKSPSASFGLTIRRATVAGIAFSRIVNPLRCRTVRIRVRSKPHYTARHHRRRRIPGRTKIRRVTRCHPRIARREVLVVEHRHGRTIKVHKTKRVVLLPHTVAQPTLRVRYGKPATVSGVLLLANGAPLAGHPVAILAAPNNGLGQFVLAGMVMTGANGSWTTTLTPGPSRLIEAAYTGDTTTEPVTSSLATLTVPAKIKLVRVTPRVSWGGTVHMVGELLGGYLPQGGALVRLEIGHGNSSTTFGVKEHVTTEQFTTSYQFGEGDPSNPIRFWFKLATLPQGDYPYAPAFSRRRYVIVGGQPARSVRHRHKRHRARQRR